MVIGKEVLTAITALLAHITTTMLIAHTGEIPIETNRALNSATAITDIVGIAKMKPTLV